MVRTLLFAATLAGAGLVAGFGTSGTAAPLSPNKISHVDGVTQVQYRRCRSWNRECRFRWGGGWRYRRCMARHGC